MEENKNNESIQGQEKTSNDTSLTGKNEHQNELESIQNEEHGDQPALNEEQNSSPHKTIRVGKIIHLVVDLLLVAAIVYLLYRDTQVVNEYNKFVDSYNEMIDTIDQQKNRIDDLYSENVELKYGASQQLSDIKNAYESEEWQNVIDMATDLHSQYNGSPEDQEAQALAAEAQKKLDEKYNGPYSLNKFIERYNTMVDIVNQIQGTSLGKLDVNNVTDNTIETSSGGIIEFNNADETIDTKENVASFMWSLSPWILTDSNLLSADWSCCVAAFIPDIDLDTVGTILAEMVDSAGEGYDTLGSYDYSDATFRISKTKKIITLSGSRV